MDPNSVQIVLVDDDMPTPEEYGGYRGYVIEVDGVFASECGGDLAAAKAAAAAETATHPSEWRQARSRDGRGCTVWDYVPEA